MDRFHIFLLLLSPFFLLYSTHSLDCSNVAEKVQHGVLNYLCNVTFPVPYTTNNGWVIYFTFDRNFTGIGLFGNGAGWIATNGTEGTAVMENRTENGQQNSGNLFNFRFRINWWEPSTPAKFPPELVSLRWGDVELCSN